MQYLNDLNDRTKEILNGSSDRKHKQIENVKGYNPFVCFLALSLNSLCFVWKFSCIKFHSLIHACMYIYINVACNFIFTHQ